MCSIPCMKASFIKKNQQMHFWSHTLFIDHTYMFWSINNIIISAFVNYFFLKCCKNFRPRSLNFLPAWPPISSDLISTCIIKTAVLSFLVILQHVLQAILSPAPSDCHVISVFDNTSSTNLQVQGLDHFIYSAADF